jgi:hypothetical protein
LYIFISNKNKLIMSIVIALIAVLVVGGLIAKFYPKQKQTTILAQGETLTPEPVTDNSVPEVVIEPLIETPKMVAKPKKKPQHKKPAKKVNA